MSEIKSYLDKDGLQTFIDLIKVNFKTYHQAKLDAGLKIKEVGGSSFGIDIQQGTYYINPDPIFSFDLGNYVREDEKVMGEIVLQFTPANDMAVTEITIPNGYILWKNEDNIYMSKNETYQIRLTTDNDENRIDGKYLILADLLNYSKWSLPGGGGSGGGESGGGESGGGGGDKPNAETMDNCVCITYKSSSTTTQILSENWLKTVDKSSIKGIYYCNEYDASKSDKDNVFTILTFDNVKSNPHREIKNNSKLIIKFVYDIEIYLKQLLDGVTFDTLYFHDLNGNLITSMERMLADSRSNKTAAQSIDFTGIRYVDGKSILYAEKCTNLLSGRLTYNPEGMALKMFKGQFDDTMPHDETNGIKFSKLTNMTGIFDGCIRESTGTEENITKLISRIKTSACNNFTYMYRNCYLANADFSGYEMYMHHKSNTMTYTGVFKGATFKNVDQLKTLYNFIVPKDSRGSDDSITAVVYTEMLMGTNLSDYSSLFWNTNLNECMLWSRNFGSYSFDRMLSDCKNLNKVPIIRLKKSKQATFEGMFENSCKNVTIPDFSNLVNWTVLAGTSTDYKKAPSFAFKDMFKNCNLSRVSRLEFFANMSDRYGSDSTYSTLDIFMGGSTQGMFAGMFAGSGIKDVKLNLYATTNNEPLPKDREDPVWSSGSVAHILNTSKTMFDSNTYCRVEVSYNSGDAETQEDQWGDLFRLLDKAYYGTSVEIWPIDY